MAYLLAISTSIYVGAPDRRLDSVVSEPVYQVREVLFFALEHGIVGAEPMDSAKHPCFEMHRVLSSGSLYYSGSPSFDFTSRLAVRASQQLARSRACEPQPRSASGSIDYITELELNDSDPRFLYNTAILEPLRKLRLSLSATQRTALESRSFMVHIVQGFYRTTRVVDGNGETMQMTVVSRRGWERAGTRFGQRGANRRGDVANFVEVNTVKRSVVERAWH